MKVAIGSDHAGYILKDAIIKELKDSGVEIEDFGTNTPDSVDYPDFAHPVANAVENNDADWGIVICGSANGVSMAANKHAGIRSAICWSEEIAKLARQHNDANVLALPARFVSEKLALEILETFRNTAFEGGRHSRRVEKI